jgi:acyl carrier protein
MTTLERLQILLAQRFALQPDQLRPDSELEHLGLDSLTVTEFMFNLEDEFGIRFPDERAEIKTVHDLVTLVDDLASKQHAKP